MTKAPIFLLPEGLDEVTSFSVPWVNTWGSGTDEYKRDLVVAASLPAGVQVRYKWFVICIHCIVKATRKIPGSSKGFPAICIPTGRPAAVNPQGTEMAGNPVRLKGAVKLGPRTVLVES